MKISEIRKMDLAELNEALADNKKKYASLKLSHAVTPLENPMEIRNVRKTIARMMTELNQRGN
ncbi:MAG: 50S ribosomal protein L29 [Chlorobi bacterium]|nr:50S ribosomal protein L29 [Chlorobiota bacterium]